MTARTTRWVTAALLAAAATRAEAVGWGASVGLTYSREDVFEPRVATPQLDIDLGLRLDGFLYHPNAFDYSGSVAYRRTTPGFTQSAGRRDQLDYTLHTTFFGARASPVSATLNATQREDQFGGAGVGEFSSTSRTFGGDLKVLLLGPPMNLGFTHSEDVSRVPTLPDVEHTADYASANIGFGATNFSYSAQYFGAFRQGTYAADNANEHRFNMSGRADLDDRTRVHFTDEFFRRQPTVDSQFNPHQESNLLSVSLAASPSDRDTHRGTYTYSRGLQLTPLTPDLERIRHSAAYAYDHVLDNPKWKLSGGVDATLDQDRLGDTETRTAGQTFSGIAQWRSQSPTRTLDAHGGLSAGLIEGGGETAYGYGASGGLSSVYPGQITYQLTYDASYASDLGNFGWTAAHSAYASAETPLGLGHLSCSLTASGVVRSSPLFGSGGSRSFSARATYGRARMTASLAAGVTSGLANAIGPGGGRGLFLALPYDQHVYNLTATTSWQLLRGLTATAQASMDSTVMADRPSREDLRLVSRLAWMVGALSLSIDDRYAITRQAGVDIRVNTVLVSAARSFGGRF